MINTNHVDIHSPSTAFIGNNNGNISIAMQLKTAMETGVFGGKRVVYPANLTQQGLATPIGKYADSNVYTFGSASSLNWLLDGTEGNRVNAGVGMGDYNYVATPQSTPASTNPFYLRSTIDITTGAWVLSFVGVIDVLVAGDFVPAGWAWMLDHNQNIQTALASVESYIRLLVTNGRRVAWMSHPMELIMNINIRQLNSFMRNILPYYGCVYIDLFEYCIKTYGEETFVNLFVPDGVHLNQNGRDVCANYILSKLPDVFNNYAGVYV